MLNTKRKGGVSDMQRKKQDVGDIQLFWAFAKVGVMTFGGGSGHAAGAGAGDCGHGVIGPQRRN